jgi:hypothetical protein
MNYFVLVYPMKCIMLCISAHTSYIATLVFFFVFFTGVGFTAASKSTACQSSEPGGGSLMPEARDGGGSDGSAGIVRGEVGSSVPGSDRE